MLFVYMDWGKECDFKGKFRLRCKYMLYVNHYFLLVTIICLQIYLNMQIN